MDNKLSIEFKGFWGDEEDWEIAKGPWINYKVYLVSEQHKIQREATEFDMRLAGYTKVKEDTALREEDFKAWLDSLETTEED